VKVDEAHFGEHRKTAQTGGFGDAHGALRRHVHQVDRGAGELGKSDRALRRHLLGLHRMRVSKILADQRGAALRDQPVHRAGEYRRILGVELREQPRLAACFDQLQVVRESLLEGHPAHEDLRRDATVAKHRDVSRRELRRIADGEVQDRVGDRRATRGVGGLGEGLCGGNVGVLADERADRRDSAGQRGAGGRLEVVGARPVARRPHGVQVDVRIYPPGQHQLAGGVDRARAARRREVAPDLGDLRAADAHVGLEAAGLGDDQPVADEEFRRFLGKDRERPYEREGDGPHLV
jgi:hypothetical protein